MSHDASPDDALTEEVAAKIDTKKPPTSFVLTDPVGVETETALTEKWEPSTKRKSD